MIRYQLGFDVGTLTTPIASLDLGLQLAKLAFEFVDGQIDGGEPIGSRHLTADVVPVTFQRYFTILSVIDPRILLFPEMHLGPIHTVQVSVEPSNLLFGLLLQGL
jgi:hypothetical protein